MILFNESINKVRNQLMHNVYQTIDDCTIPYVSNQILDQLSTPVYDQVWIQLHRNRRK